MDRIKPKLRWVRGNDVTLNVYLTEIDEEGQAHALDLDALDEWEVVLRNIDKPCRGLHPVAEAGEDTGVVVVSVDESYEEGTYGIEFLARENGCDIRSYEAVVFGIVDRNGRANVTFDVIDGERSCDVDLKVQMIVGAVTRGKNVYELWKELPGNEDKTLQDFIDEIVVQSDWAQTDGSMPNFIKNKPELATVATSGSYNDLSDKPDIPEGQVQSNWNQTSRTAVDYIKNKPNVWSVSSREFDLMGATIGLYHIIDSARGGIIISSGFLDSCDQVWIDVEHGYVKTRKMTNGIWGSWSDPIYQPTLVSGTNIKTINNESILGDGNIDIEGGASSWDEISDKPTFATVATSGSYNDLSNKPTIPDVTGKADKVASATNGHLAGLNASGNLTDSGIVPSTLVYQGANQGTVPSVDFDPETDTVHVTAQTLSAAQQLQARTNIGAGTSSFSGSYNDLTNKPTIPDTTNFVQKSQTSGLLKNDGTVDTNTYLTSHQDISGKADKVVVVDASTLPSSLDPNKVYQMGTLTGSVTIPAFSAVASGDNEAKIWCFTFNTSTTAPTITWPAAITNWVGGSAPTINASMKYEVTVMDGIGAIMEA